MIVAFTGSVADLFLAGQSSRALTTNTDLADSTRLVDRLEWLSVPFRRYTEERRLRMFLAR